MNMKIVDADSLWRKCFKFFLLFFDSVFELNPAEFTFSALSQFKALKDIDNKREIPMLARMHMTGAKTSIRRTITP